ncbi:MAG TPA: GNAT family N-acetyltransferase [Thermoanaerobaculia bacterium]|jgi:aminoglycoside 6'-N-acetyltransferase I|nr:GNAT family N-acetyltransferase [Thermoanaerobaculia bacterium]
MRTGLWPDQSAEELGREVAEFFDGSLPEPEAALLAIGDGGEAVGLVELSIRPTAEGCRTNRVAFVEAWYVVPGARGSGVGRALIDAAEEWGRANGCEELASDTEIANEASAQAHLALGFEDAGVLRCFRKELREKGVEG